MHILYPLSGAPGLVLGPASSACGRHETNHPPTVNILTPEAKEVLDREAIELSHARARTGMSPIATMPVANVLWHLRDLRPSSQPPPGGLASP